MKSLYLAFAVIALGAFVGYFRTYSYYGTFIRGWDAQMYYAQLRSAVIDGDLDFDNEFGLLSPNREIFLDSNGGLRVPRTKSGRVENKYTAGWALVTAPVFLATHAICKALNEPAATGYSLPYDLACSLWQIVLFLIGMWFLMWLAATLADVRSAVLAGFGCFLATNTCYYVCVYPMMSHAASFTAVSALLVTAARLGQSSDDLRLWLASAIAMAVILLLKPTNLVLAVCLAPAYLQLWKKRENTRTLVALGLVPLLVLAAFLLQLLVWRLSHGHFVLNSYAEAGEGFRWFRPAVPEILTSTDRGAWYFHPFYALGFAGILLGIWPNRHEGRGFWMSLAIGYLLHIYVHASWHDRAFGHSFGNRVFVDSAPFAMLGYANLCMRIGVTKWRRVAIYLGTLALIVWNVGLTIGYVKSTIPPFGAFELDEMIRSQWEVVRWLCGQSAGGEP